MKTLAAIKKAIKLNEVLKEFGFESKYIALEVSGVRFEIKELKDLNKAKKEYVTEFYNSFIDVELDENFEARGKFYWETYEGRPYVWDADYEIRVIVA